MTQMMIKSPFGGSEPYIVTAKQIDGEWPDYQSYDKAVMIPGGDSNYCTFACFMQIPATTANYEGFIFGNAYCNFWSRNWGQSYGNPYPNEPNTFYINLNDASYSDWYGITPGMPTHGIDIGEWFALMISADLSAFPGVVPIWIQKVGDNFATDISVITPLDDESPLLMEFNDTGGSITAMNSHPWFTSQSLNNYICEMYFSNEFVDWSDPDVRALFVNPDTGKPVGLTTGGNNLTGTDAAYYLRDGNGTSNEGSAGDFTEENGPIVNASTSPSD